MLTNNQEERERVKSSKSGGMLVIFFQSMGMYGTVRYGWKEWFRFGACQESRNGLSYGVLRDGTVSANLAD